MMNRRTLLLALAGAVLIGLVGVGSVLLRDRGTPGSNTNIPVVVSNANQTVEPVDAERVLEAGRIRSVAVTVSEAWGSGPTGQSNQRLLAVLPTLTDNLRAFAQTQAQRPQTPPDPERLQAARALTQTIQEQTADRARVLVTLQISSTVVPTPPNAGSPEVTYRSLELGLQKVGEDWRVSEILDRGSVEL